MISHCGPAWEIETFQIACLVFGKGWHMRARSPSQNLLQKGMDYLEWCKKYIANIGREILYMIIF